MHHACLSVLEVPPSGLEALCRQKIVGPHTTIITTIMAMGIIILLKAMVAGWSSAHLLSKMMGIISQPGWVICVLVRREKVDLDFG